MLITLLLAVVTLAALLFLGRGFLAWLAAAGIWLIGWRATGVAAPVLFDVCVVFLVARALLFGI